VLFLASIPVTILMNSLRIGVIGVLVDRWGVSMAEGFLHEFEGWVIFMASGAVLVLLMMLLNRIGGERRPWRQTFGLEFPAAPPRGAPRADWTPNAPFVASCLIIVGLATASVFMPERQEQVPPRKSFAEFSAQLGPWQGRRTAMEAVYLEQLKLDDYVMADFRGPQSELVNLYVAWYDSQRAGQSSHSPRTCIPGGGWKMEGLEQVRVPGVNVGGSPLKVNRATIVNGPEKQVVYYWFQQRGRVITNEYLVKWYMFRDSIGRKRTDGALVRLIAPVKPGEGTEEADRALQDFLRTLLVDLKDYVPD
jgi:exosortase D (VPLPA-CTERM-specific)